MASLKTLQRTIFATLTRTDFANILKRAQQRKMAQQCKFLASVPLFKSLSAVRLQKIFYML